MPLCTAYLQLLHQSGGLLRVPEVLRHCAVQGPPGPILTGARGLLGVLATAQEHLSDDLRGRLEDHRGLRGRPHPPDGARTLGGFVDLFGEVHTRLNFGEVGEGVGELSSPGEKQTNDLRTLTGRLKRKRIQDRKLWPSLTS